MLMFPHLDLGLYYYLSISYFLFLELWNIPGFLVLSNEGWGAFFFFFFFWSWSSLWHGGRTDRNLSGKGSDAKCPVEIWKLIGKYWSLIWKQSIQKKLEIKRIFQGFDSRWSFTESFKFLQAVSVDVTSKSLIFDIYNI